jgi:hypothetical protein
MPDGGFWAGLFVSGAQSSVAILPYPHCDRVHGRLRPTGARRSAELRRCRALTRGRACWRRRGNTVLHVVVASHPPIDLAALGRGEVLARLAGLFGEELRMVVQRRLRHVAPAAAAQIVQYPAHRGRGGPRGQIRHPPRACLAACHRPATRPRSRVRFTSSRL